MKLKNDIGVAGRSVRDIWHRRGKASTTMTTFGGPGANIAYNLVTLGVRCSLATVFGTDGFSVKYQRHLRTRGVDIRYAKIQQGTIPTLETWLGPSRAYQWQRNNDGFDALNILDISALTAVASAVMFVDFPLLGLRERYLTNTAYWAPNGAVFTDPKCVNYVAGLPWRVVFLNRKEADYLEACVGRGLREMSRLQQTSTWIVTAGQEPTQVYRKGRMQSFPTTPGTVVNASGGGDAFAAGVVAALQQELGIASAIAVGHAAARIAVSELSAQSSRISWKSLVDEIERRCENGVPSRLAAMAKITAIECK